MASSLEIVTAQFPHLRQRVARMFARDPIFRELCEDYELCSQSLARQIGSEALRHEYAALRLRLENELLHYVEERDDPDGDNGRSQE